MSQNFQPSLLEHIAHKVAWMRYRIARNRLSRANKRCDRKAANRVEIDMIKAHRHQPPVRPLLLADAFPTVCGGNMIRLLGYIKRERIMIHDDYMGFSLGEGNEPQASSWFDGNRKLILVMFGDHSTVVVNAIEDKLLEILCRELIRLERQSAGLAPLPSKISSPTAVCRREDLCARSGAKTLASLLRDPLAWYHHHEQQDTELDAMMESFDLNEQSTLDRDTAKHYIQCGIATAHQIFDKLGVGDS